MSNLFYLLRSFLLNMRHPPYVEISHFGQATTRPQVHVSVGSYFGTQGVYTWAADEAGEAKATMYGKGLAQIMQRRLIDRRASRSKA